MQVEFSTDTTPIDDEINMLATLKESVRNGHLEVGRDDGNRLVYRMTTAGMEFVKRMGKQ